MERPLSATAVAVLAAVSNGFSYGFDIMDATHLPSGTVYPVLSRLEEAGLVRSHWEHQSRAQREKRPPRRYYQLTAPGERALRAALDYYRALGGQLPAGARPEPARGRG